MQLRFTDEYDGIHMRKIKASELKQGKTFYLVNAFINDPSSGWIERLEIMSRPFTSEYTGSLFVDSKKTYADDLYNQYKNIFVSYKSKNSLNDMNVLPNNYNSHRLFRTLKQAQRYLDRIKRGCLSNEEKKFGRRSAELQREFDYLGLGFED